MTATIKTLGIGEFDASNNPGVNLKTYALGSCVGVVLLHLPTRTAGLIHIALPDSSIAAGKAYSDRPGYFADLGIPALLKARCQSLIISRCEIYFNPSLRLKTTINLCCGSFFDNKDLLNFDSLHFGHGNSYIIEF